MTKNSKITRVCIILLLIICAATVALRCAAIITGYNHLNSYFDNKILINIANGMTVGVCALFLVSAFFGEKRESLRYDFSSPSSYIVSALLSLGIAFLGISLLMRARARGIPLFSSETLMEPLTIFECLIFIFAILSILYLIFTVQNPERYSQKRAMLGLCTVFFFALYSTYLYFENSLPINAPNKLVDQMAYLFCALFFLFETRISLGRELWRPYSAIGLIAATLCVYSSIPAIIVYIARGYCVSNSIFDFSLTFCAAIYILMRLLQYARLRKDEECAFISALRANADEVEERLNAKEEKEKLGYIAMINDIAKGEALKRAEEEARIAEELRILEEARIAEEEFVRDDTEAEESDKDDNGAISTDVSALTLEDDALPDGGEAKIDGAPVGAEDATEANSDAESITDEAASETDDKE